MVNLVRRLRCPLVFLNVDFGLYVKTLDLLAEKVLVDGRRDGPRRGALEISGTCAHREGVVGEALAGFRVDAIDDDAVAGAHLELLSADTDDRVSDIGLRHFNSPQDNDCVS